jgi:hypothetical protein
VLTVAFVAQLLMPASWLATMFASLPAWRWFDPVPILSSRRGRRRVRSRVVHSRPALRQAPDLRSLLT